MKEQKYCNLFVSLPRDSCAILLCKFVELTLKILFCFMCLKSSKEFLWTCNSEETSCRFSFGIQTCVVLCRDSSVLRNLNSLKWAEQSQSFQYRRQLLLLNYLFYFFFKKYFFCSFYKSSQHKSQKNQQYQFNSGINKAVGSKMQSHKNRKENSFWSFGENESPGWIGRGARMLSLSESLSFKMLEN